MSTRVRLHENHVDLLESNFALNQLTKYIQREKDFHERIGNEDFSESLKSLGGGLFTATKWVGGKTLEALTYGFGKAGKALYATFADNEAFIKRVLSAMGEDEHVFDLSKDQVAQLTSDGDIEDLRKGTDLLLEALTDLNGHSKQILNHLDQQLGLIRKLKTAKNNDEVVRIIEDFDKLEYPHLKLPHSVKDGAESDILPGGKIIRFEVGDNKPSYSLVGDAPVGESGEVTLSKSDVSQWLGKIDKVNSLHKQTKAAYDDYLRLIKNWSDSVQDVDKALGEAGWLSATTHKGVDNILAGDATALLFYSGYLPRVVGYADRYIHGVLRLFA